MTNAGQRPFWRSLLLFLLTFSVLQLGWDAAPSAPLQRWVVDDATVRTGVAAIQLLSPQVGAVARGASIRAPAGSLRIVNGCDGTEVYFLLIAALLTYPFSWRLRLAGLLGGSVWIFVMNEARLLALFYALCRDRALFGQIHGLLAPLALMAGTAAFFLLLVHVDRQARLTRAQLARARPARG